MDKSSAASMESASLIAYGVPANPSPFQPPLDPVPQPYLLLPLYRRRRRPRCCRCCSSSILLSSSLLIIFLALSVFLLWPSRPSVQLARLHLRHIKVVTSPDPVLDMSMDLRFRVRNPNFFSLDYDSLAVSFAYRGRHLGLVTSDGGQIKARAVSYIDAKLRLDGIKVVSDVFYLIEDIARGSIPFDTITEVDGRLQAFFVEIPIEGKVACAVSVDPVNQTVVNQECYPV